MTPHSLDDLLETAAEVERLRDALRHAQALAAEAGHLEDVVSAAPRMHSTAGAALGAIEPVARELEREWVAQGPLMTAWQRAVDLAQLAEAAGADSQPYRAEADEARRRVEAARLETREQRERLAAQRQELADAMLATPLELEPPPPVADDARPEALRRDALELMRRAEEAGEAAAAAAAEAAARLASVQAELAAVGVPAELERRLAVLARDLPDEIELGPDTPPSVAMRLRRAGLRVR
ncbi:MAG TPA: hypothetical protein VGL44_13630 [Gaiellales bacterium]|jgi:hypothetical protein